MSVTAFNGYPVSIVVAVVFHSLIIGFLLYFERADSEVIDVIRPPVVKAILVNENPQAVNEEQQEQALRRIEEQRAEQRRQEQQRQEQQQREQAEATAEAERRRVQEQQRREAEQRQQEVAAQQAADRRQQEQQQREQERQRQEQQQRAEQQRQQELAAQQKAAAEAQARADAEAREQAETESEMVMAYTSIIHDLVQRQWSRPPSARNGMTVVLRIRLAPTGDIIGDVEIVRSSGDFAFDRAAEQAVLKVNRFTELQGMPPRMFERNFRSLLLTFRPEDLLN